MTTTREIERKYDAPEGAATPPLGSLEGLGRPVGLADETLEATYFDTADLRLLAAGVTLRRRTGGHDAGWHLKLPAGGDARDEIHFPDTGAAEPPAGLVALTRSRTRGAALAPIATLTTTRRRRRWADADGRLRVELVDDQVTAHSPGNGHHRAWRELEVELGPDADPALLDVVERALLDAGARRSASPNKLSRALGGRAPQPPAHPAAKALRKDSVGAAVLDYLGAQAAAMVRLDPAVRLDEPDAVHGMRVATRRMRSALQVFGAVIARDATRALTDELKWLAGVLGEARDLEVLRERVTTQVSALPEEDVLGPVEARVARFFGPRQAQARAAAVDALDGDRYLALLAAIDRLLADPPLTKDAGRRAGKALPAYVEKAYGRVAGHLHAAERARGREAGDPDVELHEARKKAKRLRYAAEAATPALGESARRVVTRAVAFQDLLGEHQDAVVARPILRQIALDAHAAAEISFTWGVLHGAGGAPTDPRDVAAAAKRLRKAVARVG